MSARRGDSVWVRQMVLGSGPEMVVVDDGRASGGDADGCGAGLPGAVWSASAAWVAGARPQDP